MPLARGSRSILRLAIIVLCGLLWASAAMPQSLPIPGLPGLGTAGSAEDSGQSGDAGGGRDAAPADPAAEAAESPGPTEPPADADPTQALIDILRDEAAREALIERLERAARPAGGGPEAGSDPGAAAGIAPDASPTQPAPGDAAPAEGTPPAASPQAETQTLGDRAVAAMRDVARIAVVDLNDLWLRLQRIPSTWQTAGRMLETDLVTEHLRDVALLALSIYGSLIAIRLLLLPLRRKIVSRGEEFSWTARLFRRIVISIGSLITLPAAVFFGVMIVLLLGALPTDQDGRPQLTEAESFFVNAFFAVEIAIVLVRLILSPLTPELRVVPLPDGGIRSLWRMAAALIYTMGFGQLWAVPLISADTSLFVGRAVSSVLSTIVVAALIVYVLAVRRRVARWLVSDERDMGVGGLLAPLAERWHWPVLAYLAYVLLTVMTRPGNVLLPLLVTTGEVVLVLLVAAVVFSALASFSSRRLHIPHSLAERLPLLEERVNQLVPGLLRIARIIVVGASIVMVMQITGVQDFGGFFSSGLIDRITSGLLGVLLIVGALSLVWLAMSSWVDYRLNPFIGKAPTPREITLLTLIRNAGTVALVVIGGITSLAQLGMNVGPLIASAGVIGLAISFGAQKMVEDIFSGIFIQAENAMNVGDVVEVGGTSGVVEKLTVRSVTLRDLSGVVHIIPFSSAAKVSNYMRDFAYHLADIGVAYRENIDEVRQAMLDAFEELRQDPEQGPNLIGDLEWFGLNSFGASELVMRARIKTKPGLQWGVGRAYNAIVKRIFDERGIEIPFPHQTVYFGEDKRGVAPPLHMRIDQAADGPTARVVTEAQDAPAEAAQHGPADVEPAQTVRGVDMPDGDGR